MLNKLVAVDIGNTTCEFAVFDETQIIHKFYIDSSPLNISEIDLKLSNINYFYNSLFLISSVVQHNNIQLKNYLEKKYLGKVFFINSDSYNLLFKSSYLKLSNIGLDIICKSEWALHNNLNPCIILDIGTATVLQYIDSFGYTNKVAITLGLSSIYKSLNTNTALLPAVKPKIVDNLFGIDTLSAIQGGIYWSFVGSINFLINKAIKEVECSNIYITGGLSTLLLDKLENNVKHNENIIFEGIKMIYNSNISKFKV